MTRQEAVVLSYLEWVRLIGTGAIRLDEKRVVRWRPDRTDPFHAVAQLMMNAPDLGLSSTSFVLAMLEPEVLDPIQGDGIYLGQRLNLENIFSFHSFSGTALSVHRHDADAAGVAIDLTPLAQGWSTWAGAIEAADRCVRGERLLELLNVAPSDRFDEAKDGLAVREQYIVPDDIVRARDSMFFGWACVLNSLKMSTGVAPILPTSVKDEADMLRRNFDVDQPFLAQAPRLLEYVATLTPDGERATDLLAMASLKHHERYVIKRDGAALDLPSLRQDIHVLKAVDADAPGFLVRALGERLPGELIRALRVQAAPVTTLAVPSADTTLARDQVVGIEGSSMINGPQTLGSAEPNQSPPTAMIPDITSETPASGAEMDVSSDEASTSDHSSFAEEFFQCVEAPLEIAGDLRSSSVRDQLGLNLDRCTLDPLGASSFEGTPPPEPKARQRGDVSTKQKSRTGPPSSKSKRLKKDKS